MPETALVVARTPTLHTVTGDALKVGIKAVVVHLAPRYAHIGGPVAVCFCLGAIRARGASVGDRTASVVSANSGPLTRVVIHARWRTPNTLAELAVRASRVVHASRLAFLAKITESAGGAVSIGLALQDSVASTAIGHTRRHAIADLFAGITWSYDPTGSLAFPHTMPVALRPNGMANGARVACRVVSTPTALRRTRATVAQAGVAIIEGFTLKIARARVARGDGTIAIAITGLPCGARRRIAALLTRHANTALATLAHPTLVVVDARDQAGRGGGITNGPTHALAIVRTRHRGHTASARLATHRATGTTVGPSHAGTGSTRCRRRTCVSIRIVGTPGKDR